MLSKKTIVLLLAFPAFLLKVNGQAAVHINHYTFSINLDDANDTISGRAGVSFTALQPAHNLVLDLANVDNKGKGMTVTKITDNQQRTLTFQHKDNLLLITLAKTLEANDTTTVFISYKGVPADGLIISRNKYGNRTFFADNWPNRGHNWIPCVDVQSAKAPVDFIVTAPDHYQVVANGIQVEESSTGSHRKLTHWREEVPISTKVMVIGVADFAVQLSGFVEDCIPVYSWVYPENKANGFYDYAQANSILPFYIKNVGPYGYRKLANVQSKTIFGGLENANTIFYSENSVTGTRRSESLLAHEIAHQWFGNMATEKTYAHLWLSEGFATYMTILYMESRYGQDTARAMLEKDREEVAAFAAGSNRSVVDEDPNYMNLLNENSYQKGSWVLHMLHRQLGDTIFWKSIRAYYRQYAGGVADTRDFEKVVEETSGKNLRKFFDQWLYSPGIPKLAVSYKYMGSGKLTITVQQLQQQPFFFPLEIQVDGVTHTLAIDKPEQQFSITVKNQPVRVVADPNVSLLFTGTVKEE